MKVVFGPFPDDNSEREKIVEIDKYDSWNADNTIAMIVAPLLCQLKETKHGSPDVANEDVPEHLRSPEHYIGDMGETDEHWHARWDWVLDEMIWAMTEIANNNPGEDAFYEHPETEPEEISAESINSTISNIQVDFEGLKVYHARIQKGCELFGKYFISLWD